MAINRLADERDAVLFGLIKDPGEMSLVEISRQFAAMKTGPLKEHRAFHRAKRTSQLPMPLRVLFWNYALYVSGYTKAKNFGTFGVSSVSCFGANTLELLTPLTSSLNYGQVNSDGATLCRLTFDHRVVDGAEVARILGYIEEVINYQIQKELQFQLIPLVA
ncbi:MAG: hypothetical protein EXR99_01525 [Gemmataceae bacterium]|nr:hypothetical protein [Gemmataceae bacterium]